MATLWEGLAAPWQACIALVWTAYRHGSLPIGAVIADAGGAVIARGRNMGYYKDPAPHALARSAVAHGELVALGKVKRPHALNKCVMYCSTEPCAMCIGAVRLAQLGELRYASSDPHAGGAGLLRASPYMRRHRGRVVGPESELLDSLLSALLAEGTLRWGDSATGWMERWTEAKPGALNFAKYLQARGLLASLAKQGAPAEGMLNTLEREFARRSWKPAPAGAARRGDNIDP